MQGGAPPQGGMPMQSGGGGADEPPNKRQKTEESLIPEMQFISRHPGPVNIRVSFDNVGGSWGRGRDDNTNDRNSAWKGNYYRARIQIFD